MTTAEVVIRQKEPSGLSKPGKKPFCIKKYGAEDQASDDEEGDRSSQGLRRFKDGSQGHGENGNGKGVKGHGRRLREDGRRTAG